MEQYYVVLSDLTTQARAHAFSTEERAKRFQKLQLDGAGHLLEVNSPQPLEMRSGTPIRIIFSAGSPPSPVELCIDFEQANRICSESRRELTHNECWWEPVIAANEAGLTHYHVSVANDATPRVRASFNGETTCSINCAYHDGRSNILPIPEHSTYHVAARSPMEAMQVVAEYSDTFPADRDRSSRVMATLADKRIELWGYVESTSTKLLFLSIEVDGAPWYAVYDRKTGCIVRAFQREGHRTREVIHPQLPFKLEEPLVLA